MVEKCDYPKKIRKPAIKKKKKKNSSRKKKPTMTDIMGLLVDMDHKLDQPCDDYFYESDVEDFPVRYTNLPVRNTNVSIGTPQFPVVPVGNSQSTNQLPLVFKNIKFSTQFSE